MKFIAALLVLCGMCFEVRSQEAILVDINANCGPWNFKEGGLNASYPFGKGDHLPPVVVKSDGNFSFRKGELLQIDYLDKRARAVAWRYDNSCDSEGETLRIVDNLKGYTGYYMPSRYVPSSDYPVFLMALIGVFADEKGVIVGLPFKVGLHRTVQVPEGAKQLQLGMNDDWFQTAPPNLGSYRVILKKLPQPNLVAPQQPNQEVDSLLGEGVIGISTHQMLGDCRIDSVAINGPAGKDGTLKTNDVIVAVTDASNNWINVDELKLPEISRLLRGPAGSMVRLHIMRPDDPKKGIFEVQLKRVHLSEIKQ